MTTKDLIISQLKITRLLNSFDFLSIYRNSCGVGRHGKPISIITVELRDKEKNPPFPVNTI